MTENRPSGRGRIQALNVLMMPDYRNGNPYQQLLSDAVEKWGAKVSFPFGYRRLLPISRAVREQPEPIDVLHLHWLEGYMRGKNALSSTIFGIRLLIDVWLVRRMRTAVIWTVHDRLEHDKPNERVQLFFRRVLAHLADCILVHNEAGKQLVKDTLKVRTPIIVKIPHGHYRSVYGPPVPRINARETLGIFQDARVYLHFGMLRPYKGIEKLLSTWRILRSQLGQDSVLMLVGQPISKLYGENLRALAAETEGVVFRPGFVDDKDVSLYFGAADFIVLPYRDVLTSGSVILAASFGTPVIAPLMGGIQEVLENADDLLYNPDNNTGLADALLKSLTIDYTGLQRRTSEAGDKLEWRPIGRKLSEVYRSVVRDNNVCIMEEES